MTPARIAELHDLAAVLSVSDAGALLGLGRSASYAAAARGELPTLRVGRRIVVPTAKVLHMLGVEAPGPREGSSGTGGADGVSDDEGRPAAASDIPTTGPFGAHPND